MISRIRSHFAKGSSYLFLFNRDLSLFTNNYVWKIIKPCSKNPYSNEYFTFSFWTQLGYILTYVYIH